MLIYCARSILHSSKLDDAWREMVIGDCEMANNRSTQRHDDFTNGNTIYHIGNQTENGDQPSKRFTVPLLPRFVSFFFFLHPLAMQIPVNEYSFQRSPSMCSVAWFTVNNGFVSVCACVSERLWSDMVLWRRVNCKCMLYSCLHKQH